MDNLDADKLVALVLYLLIVEREENHPSARRKTIQAQGRSTAETFHMKFHAYQAWFQW